MTRTTDEWAALLDGTTPGQWEAREDHGGMNLFAGSERVFGSDSCGDVSGQEEDVRLAAHAPAAVAEVIRLRQALEGRLRVWEKVADRLAAQGDHGAELMRIALDQITRILEGDTDD